MNNMHDISSVRTGGVMPSCPLRTEDGAVHVVFCRPDGMEPYFSAVGYIVRSGRPLGSVVFNGRTREEVLSLWSVRTDASGMDESGMLICSPSFMEGRPAPEPLPPDSRGYVRWCVYSPIVRGGRAVGGIFLDGESREDAIGMWNWCAGGEE